MTNIIEIPAISPVLVRKSINEYPRDVPMIIFGGSPHMVAEPPRLAQKISAIITGTGLKLIIPASSTVTAAKNKITVILSINIESTPATSINAMSIGTGLYLTSLAIAMHSHLKKPTLAIPSTIIIIPAINIIVAQLMPLELSAA